MRRGQEKRSPHALCKLSTPPQAAGGVTRARISGSKQRGRRGQTADGCEACARTLGSAALMLVQRLGVFCVEITCCGHPLRPWQTGKAPPAVGSVGGVSWRNAPVPARAEGGTRGDGVASTPKKRRGPAQGACACMRVVKGGDQCARARRSAAPTCCASSRRRRERRRRHSVRL